MNLVLMLIISLASAAIMLLICSFDTHFRVKSAYKAGIRKGKQDALNSYHSYSRKDWEA